MYRIGHPFWRVLARHGVPLKIRINVLHDKDAGVFVATSDDLPGLACEAATMDDLVKEVTATTQELIQLQVHTDSFTRPVTDLRLCAA